MTNDDCSDIALGIVRGLCKRRVTLLDQLTVLNIATGAVLTMIDPVANRPMPTETQMRTEANA